MPCSLAATLATSVALQALAVPGGSAGLCGFYAIGPTLSSPNTKTGFVPFAPHQRRGHRCRDRNELLYVRRIDKDASADRLAECDLFEDRPGARIESEETPRQVGREYDSACGRRDAGEHRRRRAVLTTLAACRPRRQSLIVPRPRLPLTCTAPRLIKPRKPLSIG